jgi:hypothetical protein
VASTGACPSTAARPRPWTPISRPPVLCSGGWLVGWLAEVPSFPRPLKVPAILVWVVGLHFALLALQATQESGRAPYGAGSPLHLLAALRGNRGRDAGYPAPPLRSERALLTHSAPTLGSGVEAL